MLFRSKDYQCFGVEDCNQKHPGTIMINFEDFEGAEGIEGVALGVDNQYKGLGIGKKLIEYPRNLPNVDYIWGYQLKSLKNIDDWLKRRKIYAENNYLYVTYQIF